MVREIKMVFGVSDISNIRLTCSNCGGDLMIPITGAVQRSRKGRVHPFPRSRVVEGADVGRAGVGAGVEQGALVRGDGSEARGDSRWRQQLLQRAD